MRFILVLCSAALAAAAVACASDKGNPVKPDGGQIVLTSAITLSGSVRATNGGQPLGGITLEVPGHPVRIGQVHV